MKSFYKKVSRQKNVRQAQFTLFNSETLDIDNYQGRSTEVGTEFEIFCSQILYDVGFHLEGKKTLDMIGVEIDQIARNRNDIPFYFEFKGSRDGKVPGLIRTDSTKKALCNAFLLQRMNLSPFVIMTSHMPLVDSASFKMLRSAEDVVFDTICVGSQVDIKRLELYVNIENDVIVAREKEKKDRMMEKNRRNLFCLDLF